MTHPDWPPRENVDLTERTTLGLPARAEWFVRVSHREALIRALEWAAQHDLETLVLGGGSNVVLDTFQPGLVIEMAIMGRRWSDVSEDRAVLELGAGENWHASVLYSVSAGYRGLENLALIPGTVGAAPIQNIGAYGVELSDVLVSVSVLDRHSGQVRVLGPDECAFAYRDSVFKREPGRYVVLDVRLALSRSRPVNLSYRELADWLDGRQPETLRAADVAEAVSQIRRRKLPDPALLPNAGSFFKNPVISRDTFERLSAEHPDMPAHEVEDGIKVAAGWLIDQSGWKGHREAHVGVHSRQALVLVHHGQGNARELLDLAARIRDDVFSRYGIELEIEPRIYPMALRDGW
ncbi:UDP-N-acetylmuramate dehydrogenase [Tamilnaduibacter salinus]|uniref:UDP-N-acetylenolpyruvoylglucosamine reductase n=1 Tax=Tamilnaduibacter salinus TaxID=1484056 RepID=A0A2U1CUW3_9GAMM|nr:UDP-N-acetylmuramate dehydrogenase [Tamilnaduibacter salinus]PVY75318.1 UDP-N-acetylmuramate dehydrogenase [Tamilnaduibacter salinus]